MVERYQSMIETAEGQVHRFEDWGRRQLAYPINKVHKAHYVLMNIECGLETLDELKSAFRFNDAVIRNLIILRRGPDVEPSPLAKSREERDDGGREERGDRPERTERPERSERPESSVASEPSLASEPTPSEPTPSEPSADAGEPSGDTEEPAA